MHSREMYREIESSLLMLKGLGEVIMEFLIHQSDHTHLQGMQFQYHLLIQFKLLMLDLHQSMLDLHRLMLDLHQLRQDMRQPLATMSNIENNETRESTWNIKKIQQEHQKQYEITQISQNIRERIIATYRAEIESHKLSERNFATLRA